MDNKIQRLKRELLFEGSITKYYQDTMLLPDGKTAKWDFVGHRGAAAIVPVLDDGRIVMVRQYRNALDRETLEVPAGGLNLIDGEVEPTYEAAKRELSEETGFVSDNLELLCSIRTTVAFCNEKIDIYVARNLKSGSQHLDFDEYVEYEAFTIDELTQMIYDCKIQDSKTICAIMTYKDKYIN